MDASTCWIGDSAVGSGGGMGSPLSMVPPSSPVVTSCCAVAVSPGSAEHPATNSAQTIAIVSCSNLDRGQLVHRDDDEPFHRFWVDALDFDLELAATAADCCRVCQRRAERLDFLR